MKLRDKLYIYPWESMTENNCNAYLLDGAVRTLVDPGHLHLLPDLETKMGQDGFSLDDIHLVVATHPHPDHCEAMAAFEKRPAYLAMSETGEMFLEKLRGQWKEMTGRELPALHMDFYLKEGSLSLGKETLEVIETPGHAPGSVCLYWVDEGALFSGDVVFSQSVGRVDLPGGDPTALAGSLERLAGLDVRLLLPGHGPYIEGKGAVKQNFYLVRSFLR